MIEVDHRTPYPPGKDDYRSRHPDQEQFPRHPSQNIISISWRKASDKGDPARYVGNDIGVRARGGGGSLKGIRYLSLRKDSTQDFAPIACQCLQRADRQPPTRNGGSTPSGGLLPPQPPRLPPEQPEQPELPEANEKGTLPLRPHLFRPCRIEEEEGAVDTCFCDWGTTGEATRTQPWPVSPKTSKESSVDARSVGQERHSKPHTSWPGQSRAKVKERNKWTREGQHNVNGRPLLPGP